MTHVRLDQRPEIEIYLEDDPYLHIYGLGDLDEFLWPYTTWYGARSRDGLNAVVYVYEGPDLPTVLALSNDRDSVAELLVSIRRLLPPRFFAHMSPGVETVLSGTHVLEDAVAHHKMALVDENPVQRVSPDGVDQLGSSDLAALQVLYDESYPGNWFDPRMLETGKFFGIRDRGRLISAAGVHVVSPRYRVAALGNITTHPELRNRGHGTRVAAVLCQSLLEADVRVGLNVQADNAAAIASYRKIGFEIVADYGEFVIRRKSDG